MDIVNSDMPVPLETLEEQQLYAACARFFRTNSITDLTRLFEGLTPDPIQDLRRAVSMIQASNEVIDEEVAFIVNHLNETGQTIPCCPGCSACCKQAILGNPFEAILIGRYLSQDPEKLALFPALYDRWNAATVDTRDGFLHAAERAHLQSEDGRGFQYMDFTEPCVFLVEDMCLVYPVRPYGCRSYLALSDECPHPTAPDRKPGFGGLDVGSFTTFQANRKALLGLIWSRFNVDASLVRGRFLPDLVRMYFQADTLSLITHCLSAD